MDKWKEKVEETRQDMKEGDPPTDVQEQMNEFLPVSVHLAILQQYSIMCIVHCILSCLATKVMCFLYFTIHVHSYSHVQFKYIFRKLKASLISCMES